MSFSELPFKPFLDQDDVGPKVVAADLPGVLGSSVPRPALKILAVNRLHCLGGADQPSIFSRDWRVEINHVQLAVWVSRLHADCSSRTGIVVSVRKGEVVDEHPQRAIHDRFPRQSVIFEEFLVLGEERKLPSKSQAPSVWSLGSALNFSTPWWRRLIFSSSSTLRGFSPTIFTRRV